MPSCCEIADVQICVDPQMSKKGPETATELQLSAVLCELATGAIVVGVVFTDNTVR